MPSHSSYLVVNGVTLDGTSYWITNLDEAMASAPALVGANRPLHQGAVNAYKRYKTETHRLFRIVIPGTAASPAVTTSETLKASLGIALGTGTGQVTAVWHQYGGGTKSASVHIAGYDVSELGNTKRHLVAVLDLLVEPAGFV